MDKLVRVHQDSTPSCPYCGHKLDAHTGLDTSNMPETGDTGICINCVATLVYEVDENGIAMRKPTEEEQKDFDADEHITAVKQIVREAKKKRCNT